MATSGIRVVGLDTFARNLGKVSKQATKELAREYRAIAKDTREKARTAARAESRAYAKAATGITSRASSRGAAIRISSKKGRYAWIFGEEFGAYRNIERRVGGRTVLGWNQFRPWKGNQFTAGDNAGYAVYPTIRRETDSYIDRVERAMDKGLAVAFPDAA